MQKTPTIQFRAAVLFASCLLSFLFCAMPSIRLAAQGNLMVMPKRLVFGGPLRSSEISLTNIGNDSARYDISLLHYRMREDGSMEELKSGDSSLLFADKNIRFFPRSVVLAPNESQTVRIQVVQSSTLNEGEYRSHLYFRAAARANPLGEEAQPEGNGTLAFTIKPVFGISIPVIIRAGASTAQMGIANARVEMKEKETPQLTLTLTRTGNMSVYGDITVEHVSPAGVVTKAGAVRGVAIYTPNERRVLTLPLRKADGIDYASGKLHVVYQAQENVNQQTIAQAEVYLH